MKDKNGNNLQPGDIVRDAWGFVLRVFYSKPIGWYGKLLNRKDSWPDLEYSLSGCAIEKID